MENIGSIEKNYGKKEMVVNIIWGNIIWLIIIIFTLIIFGIPYFITWRENLFGIDNKLIMNSRDKFFFLLFLLLGIILHELIHIIFFVIFSKNKFKSIKFGILPGINLLTPYRHYYHCKEILSIKQYRIAVIMPLLLLGIIPTVVSIFIGCNLLFLCGTILIIWVGSSDILIYIKTFKEKKSSLILDHPSEVGYYVYELK